LDIYVTEWHQDITKFDDTSYTDIIDLLKIRSWKSEAENKQNRRGSRAQEAEDQLVKKFI
jgi:hypothetical protein